MDFAGCVIAGSVRKELEPALLLARPGEIAVFGFERQFDPASAALVMGMAGALLQLHDVYVPGGLHPSSPVISAAHAIRYMKSGSMDAFHGAQAAGYEITNRLAGSAFPAQQNAGVTPTAACGAVGAAVAAGLLLGLDESGLAAALSNITLFAPAAPFFSLREHGPDVPIHGGLAARAGVEAALVAAGGWSAGAHALEGDSSLPGWLAMLHIDPAKLEPESWDGSTIDQVVWKLFPACFGSHATIEAILSLPRVDWRDIERVEIGLPASSALLVGDGPAENGGFYDRIMSVRWAAARALIDGAFDVGTLARADDTDVEPLIAHIRTIHDPALNGLIHRKEIAADVRLVMRDGAEHVAHWRRDPFGPVADDTRGGWVGDPRSPALDTKYYALVATHPDHGSSDADFDD
jgi:2-methylcitrate dehydratase PrpD